MITFNKLQILFLIGFLLSACSKKELSYLQKTASATRKDLLQTVTVAGKLQPNKLSQVFAAYSGYVRRIYVKVGQDVKKNEALLSISSNLDQNSGFFPLRAPFDGRMTQINVVEGQYVEEKASTDRTLMRLEDVSQFYLEVEVPELDMPKIQHHQKSKIKIASLPGKEFEGEVQEIALSPKDSDGRRGWGDDTQSRYRVRVALHARSDDFRSGMSATVDIQTANRVKVLTLPGEFLSEVNGQEAVKLKDGTLQKIQVGLRTDEEFEIISGLKDGDEVMMDDLVGYAR